MRFLSLALLLMSFDRVLLPDGSATAGSSPEWRLHSRGLGRLLIGMTVEEASGIAGLRLEQVGPLPEPDTFCTYFQVTILGQVVRARVIKHRIDRLEISSPAFQTVRGVAVGDSIARVKSAYGQSVSVEPHHYEAQEGVVLMVLGPYLTRGQKYGIAFTASRDKGVTEIWVGWFEGIRESEGCV